MLRLQSTALRAAVVACNCGLLLLSGCNPEQPSAPRPTTQSISASPVPVEVETVRPQTSDHRIPIVGTLFAAEQAVISTKVAGVLRSTFVDVGQPVSPGDPLAQVDQVDYEMAVRQAEALLAESVARLGVDPASGKSIDLSQVSTVQRAAASLANARFTFERLTNLKDAVSAQELNDSMAQVRMAEADHRLALDEAAALAAGARGRRVALEQARQQLEETLTRTPPIPTTLGREGAVEWVVAERIVTEGQYLNTADQMYRLIINDPLKLRSKVPERYAGDVRFGQTVQFQNVGGRAAVQGRIARISPAIDPASRTFEIEALIDNESDGLKSGAFATGHIIAKGTSEGLSVPSEAIITAGGTTQIFVVENGTAMRRPIQVGRQSDGRIEVISGLTAGEQVISRAIPTLADGAAVQVQ